MIRHLLRTLVPLDWGPQQALRALQLLRYAHDAIWEVHGELLIDHIADCDPDLEHIGDYLLPDDEFPPSSLDLDLELDLDELPF